MRIPSSSSNLTARSCFWVVLLFLLSLSIPYECHAISYVGVTQNSPTPCVITETSFYYRLSDSENNGAEVMGAVEIGFLPWQRGRHSAGFTGFFATFTGKNRNFIGVSGRYRYWLSRTGRIDLAPGIVVSRVGTGPRYELPAFVFKASYSPVWWVSATLYYQHLVDKSSTYDIVTNQYTEQSNSADILYGGVRLESTPGIVTAVALPLAALAVLLAVPPGD